MCEPSLIMMAIGTYMQYSAQKKAVDRANKKLGIFQDKNDENNRKTMAITEENAQQYDAVGRQQEQNAVANQKETSLNDYLVKVRDANASTTTPTDSVNGNVSEAYSTEKAKRMSAVLDRSTQLAKLMSKYSAGDNLRYNEGLNNADAVSDLITQLGNQNALGRAYGTDIERAGRPNAAQMAVGSGLQGYGQGMAYSKYNKPKGGTVSKSSSKTPTSAKSGKFNYLYQ